MIVATFCLFPYSICCGFLVVVSVSVAVSKNPPRRRCVKLSHSAFDKAKSNKALEAPKSVTSDGFPYSFVMCHLRRIFFCPQRTTENSTQYLARSRRSAQGGENEHTGLRRLRAL